MAASSQNGRTVLNEASYTTSHASVKITVDKADPCLVGYKVTVVGFTALENTVITIESVGGSYRTTETKRNDKDGTISTWIMCKGFSVGTFTITLVDATTNMAAQAAFNSVV